LKYEAVIGLEVHAQLITESKMYCDCSAQYASAPPNTHVCPVCMALPGSLPVINEKAVRFTAMTGLGLNCEIAEFTRFDRKNYFYPDLPKGYQISQYDLPICSHGWLDVWVGDQKRRLGIRRVHLEEDTGKLLHVDGADGRPCSLVDLNRAGVPLMEIVGEPDIRTPEEARLYLMELRAVLQYLGVSTGSMEEGSFRCDANISLRPEGSQEFGAKVEIKNMNSFRAVYRALEYEIQRQSEILDKGGRIEQETRGWVEEKGITVSQRSKEYAHDYRYFPEPDLPPLILSREWVEELRASLPELPEAKRERFISQLGLSRYDANLLTVNKATADYFEAAVALYPNAKVVANWMSGELFRLLNASNTEICDTLLTPQHLVEMLRLIDRGVISQRLAKEVFEEMFRTGSQPQRVIEAKGLAQISDASALAATVEIVIRDNPQAVADLKAGKAAAMGFLVGQVMKATRGKANPAMVNQLLRQKLG